MSISRASLWKDPATVLGPELQSIFLALVCIPRELTKCGLELASFPRKNVLLLSYLRALLCFILTANFRTSLNSYGIKVEV